ncbi:hypothetical protein Salat_0208100, partial [Sesamum alatum]
MNGCPIFAIYVANWVISANCVIFVFKISLWILVRRRLTRLGYGRRVLFGVLGLFRTQFVQRTFGGVLPVRGIRVRVNMVPTFFGNFRRHSTTARQSDEATVASLTGLASFPGRFAAGPEQLDKPYSKDKFVSGRRLLDQDLDSFWPDRPLFTLAQLRSAHSGSIGSVGYSLDPSKIRPMPVVNPVIPVQSMVEPVSPAQPVIDPVITAQPESSLGGVPIPSAQNLFFQQGGDFEVSGPRISPPNIFQLRSAPSEAEHQLEFGSVPSSIPLIDVPIEENLAFTADGGTSAVCGSVTRTSGLRGGGGDRGRSG